MTERYGIRKANPLLILLILLILSISSLSFDSGAQAMRISEAISCLKSCLEMFGDVPVKFLDPVTPDGVPEIELSGIEDHKQVQKIVDAVDTSDAFYAYLLDQARRRPLAWHPA